MPHRSVRTLLAAVVASSVFGLAPVPAHADDDGSRAEGRCARSIDWRIEAKPDDGRIEVEVKLETGRPGQRWSWVLAHNGSLSDRGRARTSGSSGAFEIDSRAVDVSGLDTFRFRAIRKAVVCVARVTL